jgi:hypothetical protein
MTMLVGHVPSAVLNPILEACLQRNLDRFGSVNIATLIGALTRHGSMPMELAVALNQAIVRTLPTFAGDNLCKCVTAIPNHGCSPVSNMTINEQQHICTGKTWSTKVFARALQWAMGSWLHLQHQSTVSCVRLSTLCHVGLC